MKNILLVVGVFLLFVSIYSLTRYFSDYSKLSEYGKGYVWGNFLLLALGILSFLIYLKKRKP